MAAQPEVGSERWESMWKKGLDPGDRFDAKAPAPSLVQLHESGKLPSTGRALVPGCGRGYDLELLASDSLHVTGLEISSTAAQAAMEYLKGKGVDEKSIALEVADFFTFAPDHKFDLVYDYTFACAIEPRQRNAWADKMAELVAPGGQLVTLIFPLPTDGKEPSAEARGEGPPFLWTVSIAHAQAPMACRVRISLRLMTQVEEMETLVTGVGFKKLQLAAATASHPGREGKEWIGRWQRVDQ